MTTKKSHCNMCGGERNHIVLHRENLTRSDEDGLDSLRGHDTYYMLKCAGCDEIQLRHEVWVLPEVDPTVRLYPPAVSRRRPTWMLDLHFSDTGAPIAVVELLEEIYSALQNDARRSAAMAIRSLIETIMIDKVGDRDRLGENVDAFVEAGFIAPADEAFFRDMLVEAGNAAMHRAWKPMDTQLRTMMDITEGLVAAIYIHPQRAVAVQAQIPPRKKKQRRK